MAISERLTASSLNNGNQTVASYLRCGKNIGVEPIEEIVWLVKTNLKKGEEAWFRYEDSDLLINQIQSHKCNSYLDTSIVDEQGFTIYEQTLIIQPQMPVVASFIILPIGHKFIVKPQTDIPRLNIFGKQVSLLCRQLI